MDASVQNPTHIQDRKGTRSVLITVLSVSLIILWATHLLKPLFDPDFYWHLKTGYWIWEHGSLPVSDPFSIPPQPEDPYRTRFMLTSYWMFQLLLCAFHKVGGFSGIIIFRFISAAAIAAVFYRFSARKDLAALLVAGIGLTQILASFFPERPQFISFICCAILLSVIFTYLGERKGRLLSLMLPLCLTMLFWANMHGGFLLGEILLLYILMAEAVKFLHPKLMPLSGREYFVLAVSTCSAMSIAILNPNHIHSFGMMRSYAEASSIIHTSTLENSTLLEQFRLMGGVEPLLALCTYLFTVTVFIVSRERTNITWIGLLLLLGYMSVQHIRYYPLFAVAATLLAMRHFDAAGVGRTTLYVIAMVFVTAASMSLSKTPRNLSLISRYGWVPASNYPVKVCDYINSRGIGGNIFTLMNWGGYVLWRVSPQQKIFFDGRQIDPGRSWEYFYNMDEWIKLKMLFNRYDIQVVILPKGELTNSMETDDEWQLADHGNNALLFVRSQKKLDHTL